MREELGEKIIPSEMIEQSITIYKDEKVDQSAENIPVRSLYDPMKKITQVPAWIMNTNGRINDGTSMSKSMQKKNANQLNFAEQERLLTAQMQQQDQNSKRSLEVRDAGNLTIQSRRDDDDNSVLDIEEIKTDLKGHKEVKLA